MSLDIPELESQITQLQARVDALSAKLDTWTNFVCRNTEWRKRFTDLVAEWRAARGHSSKIKDLVMHPAYQRIIGMGEPAIPLILEELERQPGHWSWALTAISGEDPVPPSARGRLEDTAKIWLQWGREKKYR